MLIELNGGVWEDWGLEFDVIGTEGLVDGLVGLDVDGLVDGCIEVLLGPGVFGVVTLLKQLPDIVPESNLFFFSTYHVHNNESEQRLLYSQNVFHKE